MGRRSDVARDRVTVQEAAARLGVKDDAIRKRIQRRSLEHEKDEDGRVYVYLDAAQDATYDASQDKAQDELVEALRDQVAYLREQLDREREARTEERRRHDTIIAQLTSRIPELEPAVPPGGSPEQRDPPETAAAEPEREESRPATATPQTSTQRPWWKRLFDARD